MADGDAASPRYRREGDRTCIDLRVKDIEQIFDNRDPMPFLERDLDDEVVAYVLDCAGDIGRMPLRVVFWAEKSDLDQGAVAEAFRKHFDYELDRARRKLRVAGRMARNGFVLGAGIMTGLRVLSEVFVMSLSPSDGRRILHEGLVIVSWVAMWRPIEFVLFELRQVLERRRLLERLRDADVALRIGTAPAR